MWLLRVSGFRLAFTRNSHTRGVPAEVGFIWYITSHTHTSVDGFIYCCSFRNQLLFYRKRGLASCLTSNFTAVEVLQGFFCWGRLPLVTGSSYLKAPEARLSPLSLCRTRVTNEEVRQCDIADKSL